MRWALGVLRGGSVYRAHGAWDLSTQLRYRLQDELAEALARASRHRQHIARLEVEAEAQVQQRFDSHFEQSFQ